MVLHYLLLIGYDEPDKVEYIFFKGGPHTSLSASSTKDLFNKANIFHTASSRSSNLYLDRRKRFYC
mgnify:CR=1 FL=1